MANAGVSREAANAIEILLKLAHHVEMGNHIRGKIETWVTFAHLGTVVGILQGLDIDSGLRLIPGLKGYEVNVWSRSASIRYDPGVFPMDLWNDFCSIREDPSREGTVRQRLCALVRDRSGSAS